MTIATTEPIHQHEVARAMANAVRIESAKLRQRIRELPRREALLRVADWFDDPPEAIQRTRVDLVLRTVPHIGSRKAERILAQASVFSVRYVGPNVRSDCRPLTERQRRVIAAELRRMAGVGRRAA